MNLQNVSEVRRSLDGSNTKKENINKYNINIQMFQKLSYKGTQPFSELVGRGHVPPECATCECHPL